MTPHEESTRQITDARTGESGPSPWTRTGTYRSWHRTGCCALPISANSQSDRQIQIRWLLILGRGDTLRATAPVLSPPFGFCCITAHPVLTISLAGAGDAAPGVLSSPGPPRVVSLLPSCSLSLYLLLWWKYGLDDWRDSISLYYTRWNNTTRSMLWCENRTTAAVSLTTTPR